MTSAEIFANVLAITTLMPNRNEIIIEALSRAYRVVGTLTRQQIGIDIDDGPLMSTVYTDPYITILSHGFIIHAAGMFITHSYYAIAVFACGAWKLSDMQTLRDLGEIRCALCKIPAYVWDRTIRDLIVSHQLRTAVSQVIIRSGLPQNTPQSSSQNTPQTTPTTVIVSGTVFRNYCACVIKPIIEVSWMTPECAHILETIFAGKDIALSIKSCSNDSLNNLISVMNTLQMRIV